MLKTHHCAKQKNNTHLHGDLSEELGDKIYKFIEYEVRLISAIEIKKRLYKNFLNFNAERVLILR